MPGVLSFCQWRTSYPIRCPGRHHRGSESSEAVWLLYIHKLDKLQLRARVRKLTKQGRKCYSIVSRLPDLSSKSSVLRLFTSLRNILRRTCFVPLVLPIAEDFARANVNADSRQNTDARSDSDAKQNPRQCLQSRLDPSRLDEEPHTPCLSRNETSIERPRMAELMFPR
jgi:hypothetical protein